MYHHLNIKLFILLLLFIGSSLCHAQIRNLAGAEISYAYKGAGNYEVSLTIYRDCSNSAGLGTTQSISYFSTCQSSQSKQLTLDASLNKNYISCPIGTDQCSGGSVRAFQRRVYKGIVNLPLRCNDWKFAWLSITARSSKITTLGSAATQLYVEAILNNVNRDNSSPVITTDPPFFLAINQPKSYNLGISEPDNDVLTYVVTNPLTAGAVPVNYTGAFTAANPFSGSAISYNASGEAQLSANVADQSTVQVTRVEERQGTTLIGTSMREMMIETMEANVTYPTISGINGGASTTINVCKGEQVSFNIKGYSTYSTNRLKMSVNTPITGYTFSAPDNFNTVTGVFTWMAATEGKQTVNFTVRDNACPIEGITTKSIIINVVSIPSVSLSSDGVPLGSSERVGCNFTKNVTANAVNASSYRWSIGLTTQTIVVNQLGEYLVTVTGTNGCKGSASVRFEGILNAAIIDPTFNQGADSSLACDDRTVYFNNNGSYTVGSSTNITIQQWEWNFGDGTPTVSFNRNNKPSFVTHVFNAPGEYSVTLTITGSDGCKSTDILDDFKVHEFPSPEVTINRQCVMPGLTILEANADIVQDSADYPTVVYRWKTNAANDPVFPNSNIISFSPSITGILNYTLTALNFGCASSVTGNVTILNKPNFTLKGPASGTYPVCTVTSLVLSVNGVSQATTPGFVLKSWDIRQYINGVEGASVVTTVVGTNNTISIPTPNIALIARATIIDLAQCEDTTSIIINDAIIPKANVIKYYCVAGDTIKLKSTSFVQDGALKDFRWSFGATATADFPNVIRLSDDPTATPTSLGNISFLGINTTLGYTMQNTSFVGLLYPSNSIYTYPISIRIEDTKGCVDRDSLYIIKATLQTISGTGTISGINKIKMCFEDSVLIFSSKGQKINLANDAFNINQWQWDYGNGITTNYLTNTTVTAIDGEIKKEQYNRHYKYPQSNPNYTIKLTTCYNDGAAAYNPARSTTNCACRHESTHNIKVFKKVEYGIDSTHNRCAGVVTNLKSIKVTGDNDILPAENGGYSWYLKKYTYIYSTMLGENVHTLAGVNDYPSQVNEQDVSYLLNEEGVIDTANAGSATTHYRTVLKVKDIEGCTDTTVYDFDNVYVKFEVRNSSATAKCLNEPINLNIFELTTLTTSVIGNDPSTFWTFKPGLTRKLGVSFDGALSEFSRDSSYVITVTAFGDTERKYGECYGTYIYNYTPKRTPTASFSMSQSLICLGDTVKLTSTSTPSPGSSADLLVHNWDYDYNGTTLGIDNNALKSHDYKFPKQGKYTVNLEVIDANGCRDTVIAPTKTITGAYSIDVRYKPITKFSFKSTDPNDGPNIYTNTPVQFMDESVTDGSATTVRKWTWGTGDSTVVAYPDTNPQYTFKEKDKIFTIIYRIKNSDKCFSSDTGYVDLRTYIQMANAFNPNSELEENRKFKAYLNGIKSFKSFRIYNRWGQVVFETEDQEIARQGWDGTKSGAELPVGNYIYFISGTTGYGDDIVKKGNLLLIR
ncbi:MAG: PKD domain-containing protein [Cytophagales bacterium]|nr:PKD domain-containing protein [Cytophagales bacterium]